MINANELRLNNLLQYAGEITPVNAIWSNGNFELHSEVLQFWLIEKGDEMCTGIPLTEDWLLKFGFENVILWLDIKSDEYKIGKSMMLCKVGGDHSIYQLQFEGKMCQVFVQFVHQLQNLYFALTGTEIELKK